MQQLIVILIGVAVLAYVIYQIYKMLTVKGNGNTKCGGCDGCSPLSEK